jgi:hypothetical protein
VSQTQYPINAKSRLTASNWKDEILDPRIVKAVVELEKIVKVKYVGTDGYNDAEMSMAGCEIMFVGRDPVPVSQENNWMSPVTVKKFSDWMTKTSRLPGVEISFGPQEDSQFGIVILGGDE